MGPSSPSPKRGHSPQFSAHAYCGQAAGWIKIPLGIEVGLGPGHVVLVGDPAPPPKKGTLPIFGRCLLWPNAWIDQDTTWYGGRFRPRPHCVRWGPSSPHLKRGIAPHFLAHVYGGQTARWIKMRLGTKVGLVPATLCYMGIQLPL